MRVRRPANISLRPFSLSFGEAEDTFEALRLGVAAARVMRRRWLGGPNPPRLSRRLGCRVSVRSNRT